MRYLDNINRKKIGFEYIIDSLTTISPYGHIEKRNIEIIRDKEKLEEKFSEIEFLVEELKINKLNIEKIELSLMKLKDITNIVGNLKKGKVLDEVELFELKTNSMIFMEISKLVGNFSKKWIEFHDLTEVIKILDPDRKGIPTFYIYDRYSENLEEIRKNKKEIENKIYSATDISEITILKEERLKYVILEGEEEEKIKIDISKKLVEYTELLFSNIESIKKIDFTLAKSKLALHYNAKRPIIGEVIELIGMFNPEISDTLKSKKLSFKKLDIKLLNGNTILTGANMGGKSVVLKTLTLNLLLGQMGFFIFADYGIIPQLEFIQFLSDDMQDVSKGLSSFGAEMIKLKEITGLLNTYDNGFIALDEFARGTNPSEGKNFVKGLSKYINEFRSFSIMATHFDGVVDNKTSHYQVVGLKNIDFHSLKRKIDLDRRDSISIIQEHMDYSIEKIDSELDVPKDALNIATLIGLDKKLEEIIKENY